MSSIIDRFKNQRVSQLIHLKNRKPGTKPDRIENCYRLKQRRMPFVVLRKKEETKKAHFGDLQSCGSVWVCPVDASIISERRTGQLQKSFDVWRARDCQNVAAMITYTTPHYIFQSLDEVLSTQDKAMRIMKQQPQRKLYKVYRTIMDEMCSIGAYTGREITFGQNGFHPHRHDVHFTTRANNSQLNRWRYDIAIALAVAFLKAGGTINNMQAFLQRSVHIDQINDDDGYTRVSKYVTTVEGDKWTLAQEATKGVVKTAKNGNITPLGMLEAIRHGDKHSGLYSAKFWEYAQTMKGKKQFFPSRGLSKFLGINHKLDEELMKEAEGGEHYAILIDDEWADINSLNIKGEVLTITEHLDKAEFKNELKKLILAYQEEKQGDIRRLRNVG